MGTLPETEIQRIWENGLPAAMPLFTSDGLSVRIFSPGRANEDGGPDFTGARIQIGGRLYNGDVEVHRTANDWRQHGHHTDPHYNRVILHVVLDGDGSAAPTRTACKRTVPLLILRAHFDEAVPLGRPSPDRRSSAAGQRRLPCAGNSPSVSLTILRKRLLRLGWKWLEWRTQVLEDRLTHILAEEHGVAFNPRKLLSASAWEQLLYEGVMEGLGFAKNRKPFRRLAENIPLRLLHRFRLQDTEALQAILFGAAGLLPSSRGLPHKENRILVQRLRKRWREVRRIIRRPLLHEADWLFFRLRPVNFPTARLAVMSFLLPEFFRDDCLRRVFGYFSRESLSARKRLQMLRDMFVVQPDEYWREHLDFWNSGSSHGVALGTGRRDSIILHLLVPAVLLRARIAGNEALAAHARAIVTAIPPLPSNGVTRMIERDLLRGHAGFRAAILRQGMMHLWNAYCRKRACRQCPILFCSGAGRRSRRRRKENAV
jgi:hypothetical protein